MIKHKYQPSQLRMISVCAEIARLKNQLETTNERTYKNGEWTDSLTSQRIEYMRLKSLIQELKELDAKVKDRQFKNNLDVEGCLAYWSKLSDVIDVIQSSD